MRILEEHSKNNHVEERTVVGFCCQTSDPMISVSLFKYVTINSFCKVKLISKLRLAKLHGQKPSSFNHSYQLLINYIHIYKDALNSWNLPKIELQSCTYYIDFNLWFTSLRNRVQHHPPSPPPTQTDRQKELYTHHMDSLWSTSFRNWQ